MRTITKYFFLLYLSSIASAEAPLKEVKNPDIEYTSQKQALEALRKKQGIELTTETNGWIIVSDPSANTVWSFSPTSDPSYPAIVKRAAVKSPSGGTDIKMDIKCGASKEACDNLVRQFLELNEKAKQKIQDKHASAM